MMCTRLFLVYTHLKLKWNLKLFFMYFYIFELLQCSTFEQSEAEISDAFGRKVEIQYISGERAN